MYINFKLTSNTVTLNFISKSVYNPFNWPNQTSSNLFIHINKYRFMALLCRPPSFQISQKWFNALKCELIQLTVYKEMLCVLLHTHYDHMESMYVLRTSWLDCCYFHIATRNHNEKKRQLRFEIRWSNTFIYQEY